jgi:hypothetical protein
MVTPTLSPEAILGALRRLKSPGSNRDIASLGVESDVRRGDA